MTQDAPLRFTKSLRQPYGYSLQGGCFSFAAVAAAAVFFTAGVHFQYEAGSITAGYLQFWQETGDKRQVRRTDDAIEMVHALFTSNDLLEAYSILGMVG